MKDLRAHAQWPKLEKAKLRCNAARARVLELWPEGAAPADLPPDQKSSLEEAESAVMKADDGWRPAEWWGLSTQSSATISQRV
jgi:hypothetical protein